MNLMHIWEPVSRLYHAGAIFYVLIYTYGPTAAHRERINEMQLEVPVDATEEDAFWTFTSMMNLHLRAYFSSKSVQMDADAIVFGKIVENLNPPLAKKLFVDLAIPPLEICRMW